MGLVMLAVAVLGIPDEPEDHARAGHPARTSRSAAIRSPKSSPARGICCKDRPLWLTVARDLLLLVPGRAVPDGPAAVRQRSAAASSDLKVGLHGDCLAVGIGARQHAGRAALRRQSGAGTGAAGHLSDGRVLLSRCTARAALTRWSVVVLSMLGLAERPVHRAAERVPATAQRGAARRAASSPPTISTTRSGCCWPRRRCWTLHDKLHVSPDKLVLVFGVVTLVVTVYIVTRGSGFPGPVRAVDADAHALQDPHRRAAKRAVPRAGAAGSQSHVARRRIPDRRLLAALHRFMVWRPFYEMKGWNWFFRLIESDPGGHGGPRDVVESIRAARKNWRPATWSASSPKARSAAPGNCCRSSAAWKRSWTGWTCR